MHHRVSRIVALAALGTAIGLAGIAPAQALTMKPDQIPCDPGNYLYTTNAGTLFMPAPGVSFKDGPGGSVTASVATAKTVSATATVSAGVTVSGIVASAKVDISASVTGSVAITVGHAYTHAISAHKYGNLEYGSWGYNVNWRKIERFQDSKCSETPLGIGTARIPTNTVGWRYSETSS